MKPLDTTSDRVFRGGGCWHNYGPSGVRAASRNTYGPADRNIFLGFRCVLRGREPRTILR